MTTQTVPTPPAAPPAPVRRGRLRPGRLGSAALTVLGDLWRAPGGKAAIVLLVGFVVVAALAPVLAPYGPLDRIRGVDGRLDRLLAPSLEHPFGTTNFGRDIFSQVIWGTRRTLSVGGVAALVTVVIGVNVGLIAGYFGGKVDAFLMRLTDSAYAIPFLPFAIVLVGVLGRSDVVLVLAVASLFWRTTARVVRSQVLTLKERPFVKAAVVGGATGRRVVYTHLAPNVVSLALLYGMLLVAEAVLAEASLSFLGLAPTDSVSWGTVMFDAFTSQQMRTAWWWALFPGLAIMLFVLAVSLLGRAYDAVQSGRREMRLG
ncbi:ABC transporter permease [Actinopolymorpha sp. B17G11]|uniref:ABC transporter permease n=1 Tax=unclassified Actinopolymorpha TaxID=2627063 RepID=UPI0032D943BC